MSLERVRQILSNPVEVVGSGSRSPLKRKVNRWWPVGLAVAAVMFSANAAAHDNHGLQANQNNPPTVERVVDLQPVQAVTPAPEKGRFQLYYHTLGAFVSRDGENKEQFMARVGGFLAAYTSNTGWEACGMIQQAEKGEGWAVRLITNGSQIGCAQIEFDTPGYVNTEEGIHSHPEQQSLRISVQDQRLLGISCGDYRTVNPQNFSPRDFANGSGYLVVPKTMFKSPRLVFQNGRGTEQVVATLNGQAEAPNSNVYGEPLEQKNLQLVEIAEVVSEKVQFGVRTCKTF